MAGSPSEAGTEVVEKCAAATRNLLNCAGSMRLLTNGALSVIWRPPLQAGDANAVQSPARMAGVGTKPIVSVGDWRIVVP